VLFALNVAELPARSGYAPARTAGYTISDSVMILVGRKNSYQTINGTIYEKGYRIKKAQ
jgi:hypothetical protein